MALLLAPLVLLVAGCGGATGSGSGSSTAGATRSTATGSSGSGTDTGTTQRSTRSGRGPARPVSGPPLGTRQAVRSHGAELTVTILSVGGLRGTRTPALPGTREVGVRLRIADQAGATYDSTASGDVSLLLSAGDAAPLDVRAGSCATPLVDFESMIGTGDVRIGCVGFSVPRAAHVRGVRFSPHGRPAGALTWRTG